MEQIPIAQPALIGNEKHYVNECLDDNWISSSGRFITDFEAAFSKFCQTTYCVATNNGTTALHLALETLGVKFGDEVIVPILTYIATANAVTYCGGIPIFVDVLEDGSIDPKKIQAAITSKTVGIIAVHLYGIPARMENIMSIAKMAKLWVVEDAAEAHGASVNGNPVGGLADIGVFSFYGNKIITTGEGGAIVTNNEKWYNRAKLLRGQGMDSTRRYFFPEIGFNYRMTNIAAAIGFAQLESIELILKRRREIKKTYDEILRKSAVVQPFDDGYQEGSVCWLYSILLREDLGISRDELIQRLGELGIESRPFFYLINENPPYASQIEFPEGERLSKLGLNLPTFIGLDESSIRYICSSLEEILSE
jgi:perosamine synthetase